MSWNVYCMWTSWIKSKPCEVHTHTHSERKHPPYTPINNPDDNHHSYDRSPAVDLWASISASHFHPRPSSLELSAPLGVSLLLGRKAKSWLAGRITTTSQRWTIWQVWEIPRFPVSSGESGRMNSSIQVVSTCPLKTSLSLFWLFFCLHSFLCLFIH